MSFARSRVFNKIIFPFSLITSACGGVLLLREKRGGRKCPNEERMDGKVVVITGANSGIGMETAREVAQRGATVVMGCRHMGRCERAAKQLRMSTENRHIVCRFLDLASLDSVEKFAIAIRSELPRVDVLVNNAGVMKPRPPKAPSPTTDDGHDRQLGINHLGHFLLTNLLLDRLTAPARVITITSSAHRKGKIDFDDVSRSRLTGDEKLSELYYQSKLANLLFTDALHRRLHDGVTSNCVDPGVVDTNIGRYSQVPAYAIAVNLYKPFNRLAMKTAKQGAQTSIYLATDSRLDSVSGQMFDDCEAVAATCELCDKATADQLWRMSEEWTQLKARLERVRCSDAQVSEPTASETCIDDVNIAAQRGVERSLVSDCEDSDKTVSLASS